MDIFLSLLFGALGAFVLNLILATAAGALVLVLLARRRAEATKALPRDPRAARQR